ncbi:MAG: class I SAM-dependent methyltransferase, partial [Ferruginibacter sp.]
GSELKQTGSLAKELEKLLNDLKPSSLLDIPCGDFRWMQKLELSGIHYTGADIVEELITKNKETFKNKSNVEFKVLNLINDPLPKSDIIIVRDCFVHFSFEDIFKALVNIKSSGSRFLLTTTFPEHRVNYNIVTGEWRTLNLQEKPFNFNPPILVINENCTENNGIYLDKSMALWEIQEIQLPQHYQ